MRDRYIEIHLELTTRCNFRCFFCPIGKLTRSDASMTKEQAFRIINEITKEDLSSRVAYHLMGEPLLHPELGDILRHASEKGLTNRVVTNGSLLSGSRILPKLEFCDVLDISLRAANDDDFSRICINKSISYNEYLEGIRSFLSQRQTSPVGKIRLRLFRSDGCYDLLKAMGLEVPGDEEVRTLRYDEKLELLFDTCLDWTGKKRRYPVRHFGECQEFEEGFSILVNGDVTTCCWDYDGRNVLGNIFDDGGIRAVLSNEKAERFRGMFAKRRVPTEACAQCLARPTLARCVGYQGKQLVNSLLGR